MRPVVNPQTSTVLTPPTEEGKVKLRAPAYVNASLNYLMKAHEQIHSRQLLAGPYWGTTNFYNTQRRQGTLLPRGELVTGLEVAAVRFAFACSQLYFSAIICGAGKITQCTTKVSRFLLPVLCHLLFNATVSIFLRN